MSNGAPGKPAAESYCVTINAAYVIVRGLTLQGAKWGGVGQGSNAHHVVIEQCDIRQWGLEDQYTPAPQPWWAENGVAGIRTMSDSFNPSIHHLVIQDNHIHDPLLDSNSWAEYRNADGSNHPEGNHGIYLVGAGGQVVIRYNTLAGDYQHMYHDLIGGAPNGGPVGNIECEGDNCNVRIYANLISNCFVSIANAQTHVGPLYLFRNVCTNGHQLYETSPGVFAPTIGNDGVYWKIRVGGPGNTQSRIYMLHNTLYAAGSTDRVRTPISAATADPNGVTSDALRNFYCYNNIWRSHSGNSGSHFPAPDAQLGYDLIPSALVGTWDQPELNPIAGEPVYDPAAGSGPYALAVGSPGHQAALRLPTFNDLDSGAAPDVGAQQRGMPALHFGVRP